MSKNSTNKRKVYPSIISKSEKSNSGGCLIHLNSSHFDSGGNLKGELSNCVVVVMVYADWCGHCQNTKPIYINAAKEADKITKGIQYKMGLLNNEGNEEIVKKLQVTGFPTILRFVNGIKEKKQYDGNRDVESFQTYLLSGK